MMRWVSASVNALFRSIKTVHSDLVIIIGRIGHDSPLAPIVVQYGFGLLNARLQFGEFCLQIFYRVLARLRRGVPSPAQYRLGHAH